MWCSALWCRRCRIHRYAAAPLNCLHELKQLLQCTSWTFCLSINLLGRKEAHSGLTFNTCRKLNKVNPKIVFVADLFLPRLGNGPNGYAFSIGCCNHWLINYIDTKAWRHLKRFTCKGTFPTFPLWISIQYTRIQRVGGAYRVIGEEGASDR